MNLRSPSRLCRIRTALAAAMTLALGACAATSPEVKPDHPFKAANICANSAIPAGWIRTNDWRGKGCGIDDGASAQAEKDTVQVASMADPPKAKAKAKPKDISRGANAVAESGPNNWMTIEEVAHARVGRSLTACAGDVPAGWVETARYWDKGRCGNPTKQSVKNVMLIERVK
jgi:hypothetical protein